MAALSFSFSLSACATAVRLSEWKKGSSHLPELSFRCALASARTKDFSCGQTPARCRSCRIHHTSQWSSPAAEMSRLRVWMSG